MKCHVFVINVLFYCYQSKLRIYGLKWKLFKLMRIKYKYKTPTLTSGCSYSSGFCGWVCISFLHMWILQCFPVLTKLPRLCQIAWRLWANGNFEVFQEKYGLWRGQLLLFWSHFSPALALWEVVVSLKYKSCPKMQYFCSLQQVCSRICK